MMRGRPRSRRAAAGAFLLIVIVSVACGPASVSETSDRLDISVSILPQRYFIERIGGDRVTVNVMVLPGESPATYEPKPAQLEALSDAHAYLSIGVPFEDAWLDRIAAANDTMRMVDTTAGIKRLGGPDNPDPHIWLSPTLVKTQARTIADALVTLDPEHESDYEANLDEFIADIEALDADIRGTLAGLEQRAFMVFHPSWAYFARDYGLEMIPVEVGGQEPSAAELAALVRRAREENIQVIFAQPEFSTRNAETIAAEIGGEVLLVSPLAEEWLENMREVAAAFADALGR